MRLNALLLLGFLTFQSYSQISVDPDDLKDFKNTETIFVLSNVYDKEVYEKILQDSWDITPYKIEEIETFDIEKYLGGNYSFAGLGGIKKSYYETDRFNRTKKLHGYAKIFTYVDIRIYNHDKILKKLAKLSDEKKAKKMEDILNDNSSSIARFYIFPKDEFLQQEVQESDTGHSLASSDIFFNYKPGLLKNYFQKINNLLKAEEEHGLYANDHLPELKNLSNSKLYIPSYVLIKFDPFMGRDRDTEEANTEDLFENYDYGYEILEDDDLSERIMNNEEFYYLRYVRMNSERFLQVVNSRTGEIVYRDYIPGLAYNLKNKQIQDLNKSIAEAAGK